MGFQILNTDQHGIDHENLTAWFCNLRWSSIDRIYPFHEDTGVSVAAVAEKKDQWSFMMPLLRCGKSYHAPTHLEVIYPGAWIGGYASPNVF
jgi:hypothetical protein